MRPTQRVSGVPGTGIGAEHMFARPTAALAQITPS
jgi:hypothetical protein